MCIWHPEADSLRFDSEALEIVYENPSIRSFLRSTRALGIAGIKGQGKTFLIKAKRKQMDSSYVLMPRDSVMIDTLDSDIRLSASCIKFLSSYTNWVAIWKTSIILTILQNQAVSKEVDSNIKNRLSSHTVEILDSKNEDNRPSLVFYSLINCSRKILNTILNDLPILIQTMAYIHTPIAIFIDKTDQAFSHHIYSIKGNSTMAVGSRNASIWQYSQLSLANAAYDIFSSSNQHIKVFYTIRQEALLDGEAVAPNTFRNFSAYISTIHYSKEDLLKMFSLYVQSESDGNLHTPSLKSKDSETAFIGFGSIKHGYVTDEKQNEESFFDYIFRHSMGRASDIQQICRDLYFRNLKNLDENLVKHYVNESSVRIVNQYISELSPISLVPKTSVTNLLFGITTNVFDVEYMREICKRYMIRQGNKESCRMNCLTCNELYPFAQLLNLGLLGYLHTNQSSPDTFEQRFVAADKRIVISEDISLEPSELYMLHPCLSNLAYSIRSSSHKSYRNTDKMIVGDTKICKSEVIARIKEDLQQVKNEFPNELVFVSSTMNDFSEYRKCVEDAIVKKGYYPVVCENPEYQIDTHVFSHDDCIDKILQCGNFITIFNTQYGGEYSGEKYKEYASEITRKSRGKIEKPSITLMEYYVARKHGKHFLTFMSQEVEEYAKTQEYKKSKRKHWKNKDDLARMVIVRDFINKLKLTDTDNVPNGNMMKFYSNTRDVAECISDHFFG